MHFLHGKPDPCHDRHPRHCKPDRGRDDGAARNPLMPGALQTTCHLNDYLAAYAAFFWLVIAALL